MCSGGDAPLKNCNFCIVYAIKFYGCYFNVIITLLYDLDLSMILIRWVHLSSSFNVDHKWMKTGI